MLPPLRLVSCLAILLFASAVQPLSGQQNPAAGASTLR